MLKAEWIYYFIEVANLSSTNLVAEKLYTSQSTISRSITQLEEALNIKLFQRTYAGMFLTEEGKDLLPFANQYLRSYQQLLEAAESFSSRSYIPNFIYNEQINIYATPSVIDYFAPAILQLPDIDTSNIHFDIIPQDKDSFQNILLKPNSFALLLSTNLTKNKLSDEYQIDSLCSSKIYISCAKDSKFFPLDTKTVTIKDLRNVPFIIHKYGNFMNTVLDDLFGAKKPEYIIEHNINLLLQHVINDTKISFSINLFKNIKDYKGKKQVSNDDYIRLIPISTKIYAELLLVYKQDSISPTLDSFIASLKTLF